MNFHQTSFQFQRYNSKFEEKKAYFAPDVEAVADVDGFACAALNTNASLLHVSSISIFLINFNRLMGILFALELVDSTGLLTFGALTSDLYRSLRD